MFINSRSRALLSTMLAVAVFSMFTMFGATVPVGAQGKPSGELTVSGNVSVDGAQATSGATLFSNSAITTAENSSAIVTLGKLGRVELLPNSALSLSFTETGLTGSLTAGRVVVSSASGTSAVITTKDGSAVADNSLANNFTVDVSCGNTTVATQSGRVELRGGNDSKQIAAGNQDSTGTAQPGTRCTPVAAIPTTGIGGLGAGAIIGIIAALAGVGALVATSIGDSGADGDDFGRDTPVSQSR